MTQGSSPKVLRPIDDSVIASRALMSTLSPLNLPAAALTVLQTRNTAGPSAVKTATDAERKVAQLIADAGENLAQQASSGGSIARGQIVNILV